jgi:hypothetical protein
MSEIYVLVESKKSIVSRLLAYFFFALTVAMLLLSFSSLFFWPFILVAGLLWYLFQFRSNREYEYSYFDGDVRFTKIMNKSRRKKLTTFTMEEVLAIAPAGDRSMYKYETDTTVKKVDYSSGQKDVPCYEMVVKDENGVRLICFEPDDRYLDAICVKYAQKVTRA